MSAGGTTLRLRAPHTVSSTSERASLTSGEEGGWVGRGHAACACACLPHRRRSPQQTTYTNGLRRARQGRGGRGRLRKGSGASRTDPTDREEVPTRKVVSNRGGVSAGVSLHRGAAVGGRPRRRHRRAQAQHSASAPAQATCRVEPARRALDPTDPTESSPRSTCRSSPRHPPPAAAPAARRRAELQESCPLASVAQVS